LTRCTSFFSGCGVTLFDDLPGQGRRRGARRVGARDGKRAALCRPIVVDLADHQLRRRLRPKPPFESAVGGDVEFAVVESDLAVRHLGLGVFAAEQLEAQVRGGTTTTGDNVLLIRLYPGAEVQRVGVVQAHLGERPRAAVQERMLRLVIERHMRTGRDAAGQILQSLQEIGLRLDV
jgi:hypothetical protein